MRIQGGHEYDKEDFEIRHMVEKLYRVGALMMDMATGELRLSSYGEKILEGLPNA
jgi:hypothetical protein